MTEPKARVYEAPNGQTYVDATVENNSEVQRWIVRVLLDEGDTVEAAVAFVEGQARAWLRERCS